MSAEPKPFESVPTKFNEATGQWEKVTPEVQVNEQPEVLTIEHKETDVIAIASIPKPHIEPQFPEDKPIPVEPKPIKVKDKRGRPRSESSKLNTVPLSDEAREKRNTYMREYMQRKRDAKKTSS